MVSVVKHFNLCSQKKYKSEIVSILNPFEGIYTLEFKSLGKGYKYVEGVIDVFINNK